MTRENSTQAIDDLTSTIADFAAAFVEHSDRQRSYGNRLADTLGSLEVSVESLNDSLTKRFEALATQVVALNETLEDASVERLVNVVHANLPRLVAALQDARTESVIDLQGADGSTLKNARRHEALMLAVKDGSNKLDGLELLVRKNAADIGELRDRVASLVNKLAALMDVDDEVEVTE